MARYGNDFMRDRDSMRLSFDLWSIEDVSTHADAIRSIDCWPSP